ncbi:MAG: YkgJ family cysteine cluster protein [Planctomycetes bacterium]|nr:YkgJ family cysteine cluster protein [Planctomycetota bacterium]
MTLVPPIDLEDSDRDDPNVWYAGGLSFQCTGCGNCCSGPSSGYVWVSDQEIERLAKGLGMADDLERFERQFLRRVGHRQSLVEYSDGDCIFLDPKTRSCSVYEDRPRQCRTWPFWEGNLESPQRWAKAAKGCPGCNQGRLHTLGEIQRVLREESEASGNASSESATERSAD